MIPADNEHRRLAVEEVQRNVVVLAGAGTGKTTLLVDRLVNLILNHEIPVEKIVALTFTKKAAEEMRARLQEKLIKHAVDETHAVVAARAKAAIDSLPKAQIGTIHSFAGYLLRLYPVQADVDPNFKEDEGYIREDMFGLLWPAWFAAELDATSPRQSNWRSLLTAIDVADVRTLAWSLASSAVDFKNALKPVDLKITAAAWRDELATITQGRPVSGQAYRFAENLERVQRVLAAVAAGKKVTDVDRDAFIGTTKPSPPKGWNEDEAVVSKVVEIFAAAKMLAFVDEKIITATQKLLLPFVDKFRREARRQGIISFDSLLVGARNLVRDNKDVREALKKQFQWLLIDEFQDTDPLQGELLFYLAEVQEGGADHWSRVQLAPGRLFVVGDPKQSIYRFRGADIGAFDAFRDAMLAQGAAHAVLSTNFRSAPGLIDAINGLFPNIMIEQPRLQPAYVPLTCGRPDQKDGGLEITVLSPMEGEKPLSEVYQAFEGRLIAEKIKSLIGQEVNGHKLSYRDMALLMRSTTAFMPYLDALKSVGIPYLSEGEKFFYRTPEIVEFLNLLASVADPEDKLALVGILRSPLGGLTDAEILDLKLSGSLDYRRGAAVHHEKVKPLYEALRQLRVLADSQPLTEVLHAMFEKTWVLELCGSADHGEQAMANVMKILQLAEKWNSTVPMTLPSFVEKFRSYRDDEREEGENPLADVAYDAVKVMSIHKAKGLEFPIVFLPNMSRLENHGSFDQNSIEYDWSTDQIGLRLPRTRVTNGAMVTIEREIDRRDAAEEIRVFYVAATRAKQQMFFYLRSAVASAPMAKLLKKSNAFPESGQTLLAIKDADIPVVHHNVSAAEVGRSKSARLSKLTSDWNVDSLIEGFRRRMDEFQHLSKQPVFVSPSSNSEEPSPVPFSGDESAARRAATVGSLCHLVLEHWDFKTTDKSAGKALEAGIKRAGQRLELEPSDPLTETIVLESRLILEEFLKSKSGKRLSTMKILGREVPLLNPISKTAGESSIVRGVIDLIYENEGELVIADYKTNKVSSSTLKTVAESYRGQAEAYRNAVQRVMGRKPSFELIFLRTGDTVPLS